jgi:PKD repeat protein
VTFNADENNAGGDELLPIYLKIKHNDELIDIREQISKIDTSLVDIGKTEFIFETKGPSKFQVVNNYIFNIEPPAKPTIRSFTPSLDTIRYGKMVSVVFTTEISDTEHLLDSIKYIKGQEVVDSVKCISTHSALYRDSAEIKLYAGSPGIMNVNVVIIDKFGRTDTAFIPIVFDPIGKVGNNKPPSIEKIEIRYQGPDSNQVCFIPSVEYDKSLPITYFWLFGDGKTDTLSNVCHEYLAPDKYWVKFYADQGALSVDSFIVSIPKAKKKPLEIVEIVSKPDSGIAPFNVNFQISLQTEADSKDIDSILWRFGDMREGKNSQIRSHTYYMPGKYCVTAILASHGGFDTIYDTIKASAGNYIKFAAAEDVIQPGKKVSFWIDDDFNIPNVKAHWFFPDSSCFTGTRDTCYYTFKHEYFNAEIAVEMCPADGKNFCWPLGSVFCNVGKKP